jgi:hypothetical protein
MALRPELVVTLGNALQDRMAERDVALANARQQTAESGDLFRRIRQFFAL